MLSLCRLPAAPLPPPPASPPRLRSAFARGVDGGFAALLLQQVDAFMVVVLEMNDLGSRRVFVHSALIPRGRRNPQATFATTARHGDGIHVDISALRESTH